MQSSPAQIADKLFYYKITVKEYRKFLSINEIFIGSHVVLLCFKLSLNMNKNRLLKFKTKKYYYYCY